MTRQDRSGWLALAPPFPEMSSAQAVFRDHAERLSQWLQSEGEGERLDDAVPKSLVPAVEPNRAAAVHAAVCVLRDLARQRWAVRLNDEGEVEVRRPPGGRLDPELEKARVRAQELVKRDEQLREPATRQFISRMERRSVYDGKFVSIFSLMRDGRELADSLRRARARAGEERLRALTEAVCPYLQFVDDAEHCEYTGLRLRDIWRYFRHTWTNQYTSTPGRSMAFLIRDRARPFHPIIGIGSLGSPIVQIRERDAWIGWHAESFLEFARESASPDLGQWLQRTVATAIGDLYLDDFFEEDIVSASDVRRPSVDVLERLTAHGTKQRELHHRLARARDLKRAAKGRGQGQSRAYWQERARSHLYRSKRALTLADMLWSRMVLQQYLSTSPTREEVERLLDSHQGRRIVRRVLRKAKADRVGIAMADITVCGAVAPYNPILGGKLVAMLAASPEVVAAYRDKYVAQESEIASSMAGRPIVRSSQLALLGTTSLYGVGSSQYNRLSMPVERIGGEVGGRLSFVELGKSEAYGTSHFSSETVGALVALVQQSSNGQRVNSLFGEGVSPKFRKIRSGLEALNLPADALLQHGRHRIVYGIPVVRNLRGFLLGMEEDPQYLFSMDDPQRSTAEIARWWTERWLQRRIESDEVLARVDGHTLVSPIRHGARVVLPWMDDGQSTLFDDPTR